jgi:hypothetical protein
LEADLYNLVGVNGLPQAVDMKPVLILPLAKADDMVLAIFVPTFQVLSYSVTPCSIQHTSEA